MLLNIVINKINMKIIFLIFKIGRMYFLNLLCKIVNNKTTIGIINVNRDPDCPQQYNADIDPI